MGLQLASRYHRTDDLWPPIASIHAAMQQESRRGFSFVTYDIHNVTKTWNWNWNWNNQKLASCRDGCLGWNRKSGTVWLDERGMNGWKRKDYTD